MTENDQSLSSDRICPICGLSASHYSMVCDVKRDRSRGGRIVLLNVGSKRIQVFDCLGRPQDIHVAERLGARRSFLPFQELTHSLTWSCEAPLTAIERRRGFPNAHSFKSRYSLIASAARKNRLRPVLLASFSSRFLTTGSMRMLTVVDANAFQRPL